MNILIVDDQESAREFLIQAISTIRSDVRCYDFSNPALALEWAQHYVADMVLLDYRMPEMTGLQFARLFKSIPLQADVPIILISVIDDQPVREAALDAGVMDFLVKPVRQRELRARLINYLAMRQHTQHAKETARQLSSINKSLIADLQDHLGRVEAIEKDILFRLSKAAQYRDFTTGLHIYRISHFAEIIAGALKLSEEDQRMITEAAPLHDIGKIAIPDIILQKKGALTEEERKTMQTHTTIGYEILHDSPSRVVQMGAQIALRHHEQWSGKGYPDGLQGDAIPLAARIVTVADVFDALTTERPYKAAYPIEEAFAYLQRYRGTQFDPDCVDVVLKNADKIRAVSESTLHDKQALSPQSSSLASTAHTFVR